MPTSTNYPVNTFLTTISLGYMNGEFIADRLFPRFSVGTPSFQYWRRNSGEAFDYPPTNVGPKGDPNEMEFGGTAATDTVEGHSLIAPVPLTVINAARGTPNDPRGSATEGITKALGLARESRVAALVTTASAFPASNKVTLSGDDQWNDADNLSNPFGVIQTALNAVATAGGRVVGVTSLEVWNILRVHTKIITALAPLTPTATLQAGAKPASLQAVAELLGLDEIIISKVKKNTAAYGQAQTLANLYGKFFAVLTVNPAATLTAGATTTFGLTPEHGNRQIVSWIERGKGVRGVEKIKVEEEVKEIVIDYTAGYLISAAIA